MKAFNIVEFLMCTQGKGTMYLDKQKLLECLELWDRCMISRLVCIMAIICIVPYRKYPEISETKLDTERVNRFEMALCYKKCFNS